MSVACACHHRMCSVRRVRLIIDSLPDRSCIMLLPKSHGDQVLASTSDGKSSTGAPACTSPDRSTRCEAAGVLALVLLEDAPPDLAASGAATFSGGALSARPTEGLAEDEDDDVLTSGTGAGRGLSRPGSASGLSSAVGSYAARTLGSLACLALEDVVASRVLVPNLQSAS
jgi:hypothetical protein